MIYVRDKNVEPEPKAVETDDDEKEPDPEAASSNQPITAGGDSAQLEPITSKFLANKRIGASEM
eukprot:1011008-Karenia_brevis.AAC.1